MLFSEPKIPQLSWDGSLVGDLFEFQCSSASRKFLNRRGARGRRTARGISVLFSEPKIPQSSLFQSLYPRLEDFSALQRAENSSIDQRSRLPSSFDEFQCSSASRKFLNAVGTAVWYMRRRDFSALQRAENSSISRARSSAWCSINFSALQRAENSSIKSWTPSSSTTAAISVLFSEPKIPQCDAVTAPPPASSNFSALQRAENSSITLCSELENQYLQFQCSSASRKFLNSARRLLMNTKQRFQCSSASRKFLNGRSRGYDLIVVDDFSALQRAENSSIIRTKKTFTFSPTISVLFSEPKIPQCSRQKRRRSG